MKLHLLTAGAVAGSLVGATDLVAARLSGSTIPTALAFTCIGAMAVLGTIWGGVASVITPPSGHGQGADVRKFSLTQIVTLSAPWFFAYLAEPTISAAHARGLGSLAPLVLLAMTVAVAVLAATRSKRSLPFAAAVSVVGVAACWVVLAPLLPRVAAGRLLSPLGLVVLAAVSLLCSAVAYRLFLTARGLRLRAGLFLAVCATAVLAWPSETWHQTSPRAPRRPEGSRLDSPRPRPNVLLIVLDTVRFDQTTLGNSALGTTPFLAEMARESLSFSKALSTSTWTLPAHASMFTGRYPQNHSADCFRSDDGQRLVAGVPIGLRPAVPTLAELLGRAGYATGLIASNWLFLGDAYGLGRGFDFRMSIPRARFTHPSRAIELMQSIRITPLRRLALPFFDASEITDAALEWLRQQSSQPTFLVINFMDAHAPYLSNADQTLPLVLPDPPAREVMRGERQATPEESAFFMSMYRHQIGFIDEQLRRLVDQVKSMGKLDNTVVVVTSDHGEFFGEHNLWEHGWGPYAEALHVPLLVRPAGGSLPEEIPHAVSIVDIFPTILDQVGMAAPGAIDGEVLGSRTSPPLFAQCVSEHLVSQYGSRFSRGFAGMYLDGEFKVRYSTSRAAESRSDGELDAILQAAAAGSLLQDGRTGSRRDLRALGYAD